MLALAVACTRSEPPARVAEKRPTLLIGLIPERNIFKQFERYEPLAAYLSERTGVDVKLKVLAHYGNVVDNFESLKLDGAFFGSVGYSLAHARLGVEPLARPESPDGTSTYRGTIVVRKDSGITTVRQMRGKRLALVAQGTFAGSLFPTAYLHDAGVREPTRHFAEVYYAGSHEGAIRDVLDRKADVGATKDTVLRELAAADPRIRRELAVLSQSVAAPENGLAVRSTTSASLKEKLVEALTAMHEDPRGAQVLKDFGASRFVRTTDEDYAPVRAYARDLGLDFATCCSESSQ